MWREEQMTDAVGVASGLGEAFIENKESKGDKVSRMNRGSGVLVMLWGFIQCYGRKSPGRAESGSHTRFPLRSRARGAVDSPAASSTSCPKALDGTVRPGILAWRPYHGCSFVRTTGPGLMSLEVPRSLPGPTRTLACMHGEETGLPRRGALGI